MKPPYTARSTLLCVLAILIAVLAIPGGTSQAGKGPKAASAVQPGLEYLANPDDGFIPGPFAGEPDNVVVYA